MKRCFVVPAYCPPASAHKIKLTNTPYEVRHEMVTALFTNSEIKDSIEILDIEKKLPSPSYMINTLSAISETYGGRGLILIGADQLKNFHRWFKSKEIVRTTSLAIVGRDGTDLESAAQSLAEQLEFKLFRTAKGFIVEPSTFASELLFLDAQDPAASSLIRQDSIKYADQWLTPEVVKIIERENLYI